MPSEAEEALAQVWGSLCRNPSLCDYEPPATKLTHTPRSTRPLHQERWARTWPSPSLPNPGRVNTQVTVPRHPPFLGPRFQGGLSPPTWGRCPEEVGEQKGRAWRPTVSRGSGLWPPARRPASHAKRPPLTRLWDESLKRPGRETEMGVSGENLRALQKRLGPTPHGLPRDGILTSCPGTRCSGWTR